MLTLNTLFADLTADLSSVLEQSPRSLLAVNAAIDYKDALKRSDPRYVKTSMARADHFEKHFFSTFGYDRRSDTFVPPHLRKHVLFFGHVGCGKSTELTQLCATLHDPKRFWVVKVDLLTMLDPTNVRYSDVWLAVAQQLVEHLAENGITVDPTALDRLVRWFSEQVLVHEQMREFSAELKTEAETQGGVPFLVKALARVTAALRTGSTHRDTLRTVVKNTYGEFVKSLNLLLVAARAAVQKQNRGQQILIVIDGTDRFRGEDWKHFFVDEANQLTMVECVAVYTAPMALKSSGCRLDTFDTLVLPMIKLREFNATSTLRPAAYVTMQQVLLKRCHYSLFDSVDTLNALIDYSGGHLRDALRLLSYACVEAEEDQLTRSVVDAAAQRLASDYRDWLEADHYPVLVAAQREPENDGRSELITRLVEGGALLEYNSGTWRLPHPVVKLLSGFRRAGG